MPFRWNPREHLSLARYFAKWILIASPVGALVGSAVALFLWSLDLVTRTRWSHPWLLFLLPLSGVLIAFLYTRFGKDSDRGNNLIMEQIHEPGGGIPTRMAPLVLLCTLITHLFGGSAGREGTAVQMGGSIASTLGRWFKLPAADVRTLLMVGVAAGFGAVFGTPLTGAIFAAEVLAVGRLSYASLLPCLIGSIVGDWTTTAWHIGHTQYHVATFATLGLTEHSIPISFLLLTKVALAAVAFGLTSVLFAELTHSLALLFKRFITSPLLRPVAGGLMVIAMVYLLGTRDYLGLGVSPDPNTPNAVCIVSAFNPDGAHGFSWFWKLLFTAVTLSSGFKGGEVTPLFFVGATLGNTLAWLLNAPVDLFAALGFVAVFAGATNTPLACTIMAVELFGRQSGLLSTGFVTYAAVACFGSYLLSGHSGIYLSQRIATPKIADLPLTPDASLKTERDQRTPLRTVLVRLSSRSTDHR